MLFPNPFIHPTTSAMEELIGVNNEKIGRDAGNKGGGFRVRYIKDKK
jgi:hypothetical protein